MIRRCCALLVLCARAALAQETPPDSAAARTAPVQRAPVMCTGQRISDIVVVTQPPYTERLPRNLEFVRRTVRTLHVNTRDVIVHRYLLFEVGDACTELARAESERILRAQRFLVDARITAYDDGEGGVRLEVETRDEFSLVFSPQFSGATSLRAIRFGEANLFGAAIDAQLMWRSGGNFDDEIGVRLADYQFAGMRQELRVEAVRRPHGNQYDVAMVRPYYTDLQRNAWRAELGGFTEHTEFLRPGTVRNALVFDRRYWSIGGVTRVGPPGQLKLLGLSVTREHHRTDDEPVLLTDTAILRDPDGVVPGDFLRQDVARVNLLAGVRRVRFARVVGFDALTGAQDVRIGMQLGLLAGSSIRAFGGQDRDRFFAGDLFAGFGNQKSYVGVQTLFEGRREIRRSTWENVLSSGRLGWYFRPAVNQLTQVDFEWALGHNMRFPFQLAFNEREGGMMGYRASRIPGATRAVMRVEQRGAIPAVRTVGDAGVALFAEAGRLWRGGAPYGVTTPLRGTVGVSLQAAVPPRSRRLWRIDFGLPVGGDPDARFEIRVSSRDRSRTFWTQPNDVLRARERTAPTSIFSWP